VRMPAMCDERDRLLGYLYDECDAAEKRTVESHLQECPGCREEIAGLRRVRTDLLAWDVPDHGSVWTPFVKSRMAPSWREVPVWAMAAAAGLVFVLGGAGAITAQALAGRPAVQVATTQPAAVSVAKAMSEADVAAMEQRIVQAVRTDMDARMQLLSAHETTTPVRASDGELLRRVSEILKASDLAHLNQMGELHNTLMRENVKTDARFTKVEDAIAQIAAAQAAGGKQ
jgi:hypothetical protein